VFVFALQALQNCRILEKIIHTLTDQHNITWELKLNDPLTNTKYLYNRIKRRLFTKLSKNLTETGSKK